MGIWFSGRFPRLNLHKYFTLKFRPESRRIVGYIMTYQADKDIPTAIF
jgi:hypothetical protein